MSPRPSSADFQRPASLSPRHHNPTQRIAVTRHQRGFTTFTLPALPLTCDTQSEWASLGFSLSSEPGHYWPRTSGRGPVSNTDQDLRLGHVPDLQSTYSLNACDLVSQLISADPARHRWSARTG